MLERRLLTKLRINRTFGETCTAGKMKFEIQQLWFEECCRSEGYLV